MTETKQIGLRSGWRRIPAALLLVLLATTAVPAGAAVPPIMNFQGRLTASDGTPEVGIQSIGFALYDAPTGGSPLWSETQTVAFADGFYSVMLGNISPLPLSVLDDPLYISVTIAGTELLPRMQIASVAFALRTAIAEGLTAAATGSGSGLDADSLDGLDVSDLATAGHTHPAGDADTLDGIDSAGFSPAGHTHSPGDADTLDGIDSTGFSPSGHAHAHGALTGVGAADHHTPYADSDVAAYLGGSRRNPFSRNGSIINYTAPDGTAAMLDIGTGLAAAGNAYIAYAPGGAGDATLYFNIDAAPSIACTLLHNEDDAPYPGYYFATDGGNGYMAIWGNTTTGTFIIRREGVSTMVLSNWSGFQIFCP